MVYTKVRNRVKVPMVLADIIAFSETVLCLPPPPPLSQVNLVLDVKTVVIISNSLHAFFQTFLAKQKESCIIRNGIPYTC